MNHGTRVFGPMTAEVRAEFQITEPGIPGGRTRCFQYLPTLTGTNGMGLG
jgi:hypothetical protein